MEENKAQQVRSTLRTPTQSTTNSGSTSRVYANEKEIKRNSAINLFRVVGGIDSFNTVWRTWVICDDGKPRPFNLSNDHEGDGLFYKLLGDANNFYKGGILESRKGADGKQEFIYSSVDAEFIRSITEGKIPGKETRYSWKPKREWLYNIIDRDPDIHPDTKQPYNWCAENKHTKLLRIRVTAWTSLDDTNNNDGDLTEYDCVYRIDGQNLQANHNIRKAGIQPGVVNGPLSDAEKAYVTYDLKKETKLSSATWILKNLEQKIARADEIMGSNYLEEFKAQSEVEKAAWAAQNNSDRAPEENYIEDSVDESKVAAPVAAPQPTVQVQPARQPARRLPEGSAGTIPCPALCGAHVTPDTDVCPNCKTVLLAPCDKCQKPFSTFAKQCPHCGQTY